MPILAPLQPFFEAMNAPRPKHAGADVAELRAGLHAMMTQSFGAFSRTVAPAASERDYRVAVAGGEITVRIYGPGDREAALPCYLYLHGGGFWLGTLEHADDLCRAIAADVGCVVASVDYRLAPEHKFPVAAEDSYAALLWLVSNASELGIDPARIAVGGGSAGGNLAAVLALLARDRSGPALVQQVLEIPVTDFTRLEPLRRPQEDLVVESGKAEYGAYYLADPEDANKAYASPLLAPDLSGLPPALVMCAEYDPLRPEGEAYAQRLRSVGVAVDYRCWDGQFHGSQGMAALIPEEAAAYHSQIVETLRHAFGLSG